MPCFRTRCCGPARAARRLRPDCARLRRDRAIDRTVPNLVVESGPLAGERYSFARRAVVGRGQLADVRIEHETISRRHCEIRPRDGAYELVDLGSANGTRLNGAPLVGTAPLGDGDRIALGMVTLVFSVEAEEDRESPETGSALYRDTLARIALFCELGELISAAAPGEEQVRHALAALRRAYPRVDQIAVLVRGAAGDRFTLAASTGSTVDLAVVIPRAREALRHERGHAAIENGGLWAGLPARYAGEVLGVLYLASAADPEALRITDRDALCAVAALVAPMLAPARAPNAETARDDRDLALARRIQQRFLPQAAPLLPGYAIVDSYTAARVVGGDHFDYLTLADGRTVFVVADVSGKAVSGALYMARLGPMLKQAAAAARDPAALLGELNAQLLPELEAGMFVTMLALALDPVTARIEAASAGHPAPFKRQANGYVDAVPVPRGPPLGAMPGARYESHDGALARGEYLLIYTDGLDEAHDARQSLFGAGRIVEALVQAPHAADAIEQLTAELGTFVGETAQSDDLTMVVLERL